ncbi:MAG: hypothetical protein QOF48_502 [Verrucomicrobiota bacterium]
MKRQITLLLFLCGLVLAAPAAPVPPPEKLLPRDTLFVFTIPEYAKASMLWDKWPSSLFWNDVAMKPFRDKFVNKFKTEIIAPFEKELGFKFADYSGLARGQVTFAIMMPAFDDKEDKTPAFFLLVDSRDKSDALKTNLVALKKKWVEGGRQTRIQKIRDVDFSTLVFKSDELGKIFDKMFPDPNSGNETLDAPKPKKPVTNIELLVGQSDSLFVLGNSVKDVEKVLAAQSGATPPTLLENPAFAKSHNTLFRDSLGYGWLHLKPLIEGISKALSKPEKEGAAPPGAFPKMDTVISVLGLNGLEDLAFNLRDTGDGALMNFDLHVPASARKGLVKVFTFDTKDANPPPFVPADAVKFSRFRLDLSRAWNTLEQTLVEAVPQLANVIKMVVDVAGKDKDPNFDIRKQLFANLGDDLISYQRAPRKQTLADLQSPPSITLISSPKPEQLAGAVKALTSLLPTGGGKVKEREFLGRKVYSMTIPQPGAGGKMNERTLSYAASGGYLALSTDTATLEEFMRAGDGPSKTLRDLPGLADAAQKVGGMGTGMFGYENVAETWKSLMEIMKKDSGTLANLFAGSPIAGRLGMEDDAKKFKDWLDFSLLPGFDKVSKYFYITVYSGSVNADGFSLKAYVPTPPGIKTGSR